MASDVDGAQDRVILASFENRRAAEHNAGYIDERRPMADASGTGGAQGL